MLIWLNGPFGVGKTSVANELVSGSANIRVFDPELVGSMLRKTLQDFPSHDFQDLSSWRALVPRVAMEVGIQTGHSLVAVQSVLVEKYWADLLGGFRGEGMTPIHVLLDCEQNELRRRIFSDKVERNAEPWRLDHIEGYFAAREWLCRSADLVVDTTNLSVSEVADVLRAKFATDS